MRVLASFSLHHLDIPAIYIDLGLYSPFMSVAATFMGLANHRTHGSPLFALGRGAQGFRVSWSTHLPTVPYGLQSCVTMPSVSNPSVFALRGLLGLPNMTLGTVHHNLRVLRAHAPAEPSTLLGAPPLLLSFMGLSLWLYQVSWTCPWTSL